MSEDYMTDSELIEALRCAELDIERRWEARRGRGRRAVLRAAECVRAARLYLIEVMEHDAERARCEEWSHSWMMAWRSLGNTYAMPEEMQNEIGSGYRTH